MRLYSSAPSPFGRKVKICLDLLGLKQQVDIVNTDVMNPEDPIFQINPLGKIPALVIDQDQILFDSRVICEYLDNLSDKATLFPQDHTRWECLRMQALADGILDANILRIYETRYRTETERSETWVDMQTGKIDRALAILVQHLSDKTVTSPDIGDIAVACALGHLDLRAEGRWRHTYPALVPWLDSFKAAVPAYAATEATL